MLDILTVAIIVFFLYKIKPNNKIDEYLSPSNTIYAKGMLAILVIFHHISQETTAGTLFREFENLGPALVAIFFFYSGFGLMTGCLTRPNYMRGFIKKRFPKLLIPYLIACFVYFIAKRFLYISAPITLQKAASSFMVGSPYVTYSWYVIAQLIFYIMFFIAAKIIKNKNRIWIFVCLAQILYILACIKLSFGFWWYGSSLSFTFGVFWRTYEDKIKKLIIRGPYKILIVSLALFLVFFITQKHSTQIQVILNQNSLGFIKVFITTGILNVIMFSIFFVVLGYIIKSENKALKLLGEISYEIYLYHGLSMLIFKNQYIYFSSDWIFVFSTVVGAVILGFIFHNALKFCENFRK